jgi:hypothetical protein
MTPFPSKKQPSEPDRWAALTQYNAERWRGIVHTAEYQRRMVTEQELFAREQALHKEEEVKEMAQKPRFWGSVASVALMVVVVVVVVIAALALTT